MHSLEAACNEAQNLIDKVEQLASGTTTKSAKVNQSPLSAIAGPSWSHGVNSLSEPSRKSRVFNIRQRLRELYLEECRNAKPFSSVPVPLRNLKRGSRLLEKLVQRENLNTLIVNLYAGNKGYSLSLRLQGKVPAALGNQAGRSQGSEPVTETMRWPYSDEELLRSIDNEEIPATLVDLLEANHSELFYQGCVIAEIRDYRLTYPLNIFEAHHVLLKPTTQSIISDVNLISTSQDLSAEDRLKLESQLVLATAPPLCLDPNPAVGILLNNLHHKKQRLSSAPFRRTARKFSQVTVNRKRKLDHFTAHNTLQLYDFITRRKAKIRAASQGKQAKKTNEGVLPTPPPVPTEDATPLHPPSVEPDVFKYAKHYDKPKETTDCTANLIEEYILETERGQGRIYHIKLTILQRYSNSEYLGELYVDRDYKEGERNGASCRFVLGTRVHANRYIQQFTEIFTEEGRKSVRITHVIPGQQHRVSFTPGMRERNAAHAQAQQERNAAAAAAAAAAVNQIQQSASIAAQGKQTAILNNTQGNPSSQNSNLQHILPNPHQISISAPHLQVAPSGTINFNLNSQQIQKIQGQLSTANTAVLSQNPNQSSTIQINSVSHLTSLLTNSNIAAPPNANVHQIQQGQNVIGIAGQSVGTLAQSVQSLGQNVVNVQNIGIGNQNLSNSAIQSLLNNALSTNTLEGTTNALQNGPISTGAASAQNTANVVTQNATVHHPPSQSQVPATKPSRPPMAANPTISALVTSLMNSAQQFQVQQAAQQAANNASAQPSSCNTVTQTSTSNTNQNPTILSLLNATTPLNVSNSGNNNVISTSHVNLNQQNHKLLTRKTTLSNLLNSRLINPNLSAALNNNVSNPTLVVNNTNPQKLRVRLSSFNQIMNASGQATGSPNQTPQILNIGSVNQISNSSTSATGFTIATTQGSITIPAQAPNLTTQTFTISNTNSQTFTITTPNPAQTQTYSLTAPGIGNLNQAQSQTFTLTPNTQSFTISPANTNSITSSGFTISPANSNALSSTGFTISPAQNNATQPQTFTVLQPNQNLGNQSFTITAPVVTVGNQGFTVTNAQQSVGSQAFTITNSNLPTVQNKTFQINNAGTTNQTFTITTPVVTVASQFVNCQSPASSQNYANQSPSFTINAPSPQTNTSNVFTVNSPVPNQVFTVNIPSPVPTQNANLNATFSNASQQNKNLSSQNNVLLNKNQTFTINANNQNFTVTTPIISSNQNFKTDGIANNNNMGGSSTVNNDDNNNHNSNNSNDDNDNNNNNSMNSNSLVNASNTSNTVVNNISNRIGPGRIAACQRRLSNALQQASQTSELNKLLNERSDSRLLTEASKHFSDKSERILNDNPRLTQALSDSKKLLSENSKLSQALSGNVDCGTTSSGNIGHSSSSSSNLGLSMPGLSALLAGTPSADNPIPGASNSSSLLERLTSSTPNVPAFTSPPPMPIPSQSPISAPSPNQNLNFQNSSFSNSPSNNQFNSVNSNSPLPNLTNPNVPNFTSPSPKSQVQFQNASPNAKEGIGISSPLSSPPGTAPVSLNLPGLSLQGISGLQNVQVSIPGLPVPISLSLNVSGQPGGTQNVLMTSLPVAPTTNTTTTTTSAATMVLTNSSSGTGNLLSLPVAAQLMAPGVKNTNQRATTPTSISLAQLQLALQKQAQIQSMQQCFNQQNQKRPISPSSIANKHRRRSNAADNNK